jgi:hypothetical protein
VTYEEFLAELYSGLKDKPFRLKDSFIQNADATVGWLWLTTAKDQSKSLPTLNALAREDHYDAIRAKVAETAGTRNKKLANVILRIHIDLKEQVEDNAAVDNGDENEGPGYGRPVAAIISSLDCSPPPLVNVQNLRDCHGHR